MKWDDERWIKLYTRDTTSWKLLPWQGKALLPLLLRKLDRAGNADLGESGPEGVAALTDMPLDFVRPGLDALLKAKMMVLEKDGRLHAPNFKKAQEALTSVAQRKRKSREKAALEAKGHNVTDIVTGDEEHASTPPPSSGGVGHNVTDSPCDDDPFAETYGVTGSEIDHPKTPDETARRSQSHNMSRDHVTPRTEEKRSSSAARDRAPLPAPASPPPAPDPTLSQNTHAHARELAALTGSPKAVLAEMRKHPDLAHLVNLEMVHFAAQKCDGGPKSLTQVLDNIRQAAGEALVARAGGDPMARPAVSSLLRRYLDAPPKAAPSPPRGGVNGYARPAASAPGAQASRRIVTLPTDVPTDKHLGDLTTHEPTEAHQLCPPCRLGQHGPTSRTRPTPRSRRRGGRSERPSA